MTTERRSTRAGAALLIMAFVLRLLSSAPPRLWAVQKQPPGSLLRLPLYTPVARPEPTEPPPTQTAPPDPLPVFSEADLALTPLRYSCDYRPSLQALLTQPLDWHLADGEPAVLIVHTHGSECYTRQPGQTFQETAPYRTLDTDCNMVAVGDYLALLLEQAGIVVIHDRQLHDYPSYPSSYTNSRKSVKAYLARYPGIRLVLDLHRDAGENSDGSQFATAATVDGRRSAQLMFLVGTDASGNHHPNWQDNLALAAKLNVLLERDSPGVTRKATLRAQRFNQDLAPLALLVEVGSAGNTLQEALTATTVLARAIIALSDGSAS